MVHTHVLASLGTHCIGVWVGPRTGLDGCGKSSPTGFRSPDRPESSKSLYRLRYSGLPKYSMIRCNIYFYKFTAMKVYKNQERSLLPDDRLETPKICTSYVAPKYDNFLPKWDLICLYQWPRGLRRRSTASRLLEFRVWIPPGGMDVCLLWELCVSEVSAKGRSHV
jgi:hypothetical protein